jgi:hypothetical protein
LGRRDACLLPDAGPPDAGRVSAFPVSNTGTCTPPAHGACSTLLKVDCPAGTVPISCSATPQNGCSDGSIGTLGTFLDLTGCEAIAFNNSPQGLCGPLIETFIIQAMCLSVP